MCHLKSFRLDLNMFTFGIHLIPKILLHLSEGCHENKKTRYDIYIFLYAVLSFVISHSAHFNPGKVDSDAWLWIELCPPQ